MLHSEVTEKDKGVRLDMFVLQLIRSLEVGTDVSTVSREQVQNILSDIVTINSLIKKPSYRLKQGDQVEMDQDRLMELLVNIREKRESINQIQPIRGDLEIIEESRSYLVLNKPRGLAVHPGIGNEQDNLANRVNWYFSSTGVDTAPLVRSGLVHRLDKPVGGLIIFAKDRSTQIDLADQFSRHTVLKIYHAHSSTALDVIGGENKEDLSEMPSELDRIITEWKEGGVDSISQTGWLNATGVIERDPLHRKRMWFRPTHATVGNSRNSVSFIRRYGDNELLIRIETGRTHQIRATLMYLGCPIDGDSLYSSKYSVPEQIDLTSVVLGIAVDGEDRVWRII